MTPSDEIECLPFSLVSSTTDPSQLLACHLPCNVLDRCRQTVSKLTLHAYASNSEVGLHWAHVELEEELDDELEEKLDDEELEEELDDEELEEELDEEELE